MSHGLTKHAFKSSQGSWGLPARKASKPINVRFEKDEPHEINEVALHVTL